MEDSRKASLNQRRGGGGHNHQNDHHGAYEEHDQPVLLRVAKLEEDSKRDRWNLPSPSSQSAVENTEYYMNDEKVSHMSVTVDHHGLGVWMTSLFIIAEMVGAAIASIPNAVYRQGWFGIVTLVVGAVASGYTGAQLGWCWTILQERWPDAYLKQHTRKPYPEMGYRAGGRFVKFLVSACVNVTIFGASCVFLIIAANNISSVLETWLSFRISFCYWILIVGAILLPLTFLGSPKDFWPAALGAAGATIIAIVIILIAVARDYSTYEPVAEYPNPGLVDFVLGYGAIIFAYGGHSAFPTIQHDMRVPAKFPKSVFWAYAGIFVLYIPFGLFCYVVYGAVLGTDVSILNIIQAGWMRQVSTILITVHVILAFIIVSNPLSQELENLFKSPTHFTWKRALIRTCYICVVIFASESIPSFGMILDIIGGTTIAAMTFVFPGWFYIALRYRTRIAVSECDIPVRWWEWPLNVAVVAIGVLGGVASIYAGVMTVIEQGDLFKMPCYLTGG